MSDQLDRVINYLDALPKEECYFTFGNYEFVGVPGVFFVQSTHTGGARVELIQQVASMVQPGAKILEIGCGTGCGIALLSLMNKGEPYKLLASDINDTALTNTKSNFCKHSIQGEVRKSDVFDNIGENEHFDIIYWATPFAYVEEDVEVSILHKSLADPGYLALDRFLAQCHKHLTPNGRAILGFSCGGGNYPLLLDLAKKHNKRLSIVWEHKVESAFASSGIDIQLIEVL